MTPVVDERTSSETTSVSDNQATLLAFATIVLTSRKLVLALVAVGLVAGAATALLTHRVYTTGATFIPQSGNNLSNSALALAASQFGVRMPTADAGWGPAVYVELLESPALLEQMTTDTLVVPEEGGRRVALMDLLKVKGATPALRHERGMRKLREIITATEINKLGAVRLRVSTRWPSVSHALADDLVKRVNDFNLNSRKSQASAERRFAESQSDDALRELRAAEDRLQTFMQTNRAAESPALRLQQDRLQREVTFRQQVYNTLMQSLEEARLREVRDTPVITVLEMPRIPAMPESRRVIGKTFLGAVLGLVIGVLIAFVRASLADVRGARSPEAHTFLRLVEQATPRFLRRA